MKRFAICLLCAAAGYAALALAGYAATQLLSSNMHDRDMEAGMTAVFVTGPLGAVIGALVGAWLTRRRQRPESEA